MKIEDLKEPGFYKLVDKRKNNTITGYIEVEKAENRRIIYSLSPTMRRVGKFAIATWGSKTKVERI